MANNQMPHNIEAEAALLGCLIIDAEIQSELLETLTDEDFYQDSHKEIVNAMRAIYGARKTVDVVTLCDRLEKDGALARAGGIAYITELAQITPSSANYKQYYEIIHRDSIARKLIRAATAIAENSRKGLEEREALAFAEKQVYDISKQEDRSGLEGMADGVVIQEVLQKFETIQANPHAFRGVETGFTQLDALTGGLQKSDLIVLAARPGMGKTSFAMNIVEHAALVNGKVCAVFSLEMPRVQLVQRLLCAHAEVSMGKALKGQLVQKEWRNLMRASDKLQKSKIYIDDNSRISVAEILSKCRRLKSSVGLDLIMIDYIQLMGEDASSKAKTSENRQQEIANITRNLKIMAKELDVPVIALSQLRRIQTKEPQLSDLRESGAIEQDADIVMFINRPEQTATPEELAEGKIVKGAANLNIVKHRNGSPGRVQLRFIGESTKFVDAEDVGRPNEEVGRKSKETQEYEEGEAGAVFPAQDGDVPPEDDSAPPEDDSGIPLD